MESFSDSVHLLFICPVCHGEIACNEFVAVCQRCGFRLERDGHVWCNPHLAGTEDDNYYQDIDYMSRASLPFTTTAREAIQYYAHLGTIVGDLGPDIRVLDLGCGDGRFTVHLQAIGIGQIVACDLDLSNLRRSERRLGVEQRQGIVLLHADALKLPLADGVFDAVFAIGILNTLGGRFVEAASKLHRLLKPGGILVNSEPTLEGSLIFALVRHDLEEFLDVARTSTKAIDIAGDKRQRYPVFEHGKVETLLSRAGFDVQRRLGIQIFPSLVFGGMLQLADCPKELKATLAQVVDDLGSRNIPVHRAVMYVSRKRQDI